MRSFVAGLIPKRAGLLDNQYVPKPVIETFSPVLSVRSTMRVSVDKILAISFLLKAVSSLSDDMRSFLFIASPLDTYLKAVLRVEQLRHSKI